MVKVSRKLLDSNDFIFLMWYLWPMAHGQWDRFRRNYKVDESKMGAMFARKILSKHSSLSLVIPGAL